MRPSRGKERGLNRKLAILATALMLVAIQACSGTSSPSPSAAASAGASPAASGSAAASSGNAAPVTISLWHNYGTEANATATENLVKAYQTLHPNVTIDVVSQPGVGSRFTLALPERVAAERNSC